MQSRAELKTPVTLDLGVRITIFHALLDMGKNAFHANARGRAWNTKRRPRMNEITRLFFPENTS